MPGSFFTSSFNFTGMLFVYLSINYLKLLVVHYQSNGRATATGPPAAQETPKPTLKASVKVRDEFSSA